MDGSKRATILKQDALGRVGTKREQREALLDEFERSGLKGAQFARAAGIKYQTFANWVQQRRHARGDYGRKGQARSDSQPVALRLVEAVLAAPVAAMEPKRAPCASAPAVAEALEVHLPCGARLLIATAQQAVLAVQFIQALRTPC